jgi:glycosyltransferase involved in cell wall biosynthesis
MKKKIAFVINSLAGGGAEKQVSRMLDCYINSDWSKSYEVDLILLDIEEEKQKIPEGVRKITIDSKGSLFQSTVALLQQVKHSEYAMLISFLTRSNCAAIVVGRLLKIPVVISERVNTTAHLGKGFSASVNKAIVRLLYPWASHICCVSSGVREELLANYSVVPKKASVIYNGYNYTELNNLALESVRTKAQDYICAVGRLVENKNFSLLLKAYQQSGVDLPLLIAGDGPLKESLKNEIVSLGLSEKVTLLGYVSNPYPIIRNSKFLVASSNAEGFPNVIAESLVLGVAVVATDCPSGPAEVLDGSTASSSISMSKFGILVKCGDVNALASAISLMNCNEHHSEYTKQANIRGREFTIQKTTDNYFSIVNYWTNCNI